MFAPKLALVASLLLLGSPGAPPVASPAVAITGRVVSGSGSPLRGAQVTIVDSRIGTLTNSEGRYLILAPDTLIGRAIRVTAVAPAYTEATDTLVVREGRNLLDFVLESREVELDAVPVTASRDALEYRGVDMPGMTSVAEMLPPPPTDREGYAAIEENAFRSVSNAPLSTFSIDVDRASYANVRRFLNEGRLPPRDAVRIEELINYFPYDDPEPSGDAPLEITTEYSTAPWNADHGVLRIALKGRSIDMADAPPANLVFLMDVSGSMNAPDKLPLLKTAFRLLVESMRPRDRVAIVAYAGSAGLVLESTSGNEKPKILEAIERLRAGGSTAGGSGIRLAYDVAAKNHIPGGNNRVILATDGDFNVGASSDAEMVELIEEKREQGTFLTVLGFGTGNLQDAKMEQIADHGDGNFHYIDSALEARKSLVAEAGGTLVTVARDVKIQVEFNPAAASGYRLIGYENRLLANEDFNDDEKDAGELGAGHSVVALYEVVPAGQPVPGDPSVDDLRYSNGGEATGDDAEVAFVKLRWKEPEGGESRLTTRAVLNEAVAPTANTRWATAVAAFGMLLRESPHIGAFAWDDVIALARSSRGADVEGYRSEFVRLVEVAQSLGAGN